MVYLSVKETIKKYKEWIMIAGVLTTIFGGVEMKRCSDEAQEWVQMFMFSDRVLVESNQKDGVVGSITDTNKVTKAEMPK
jgi:hypothetical protein